jgi:transposase
MGQKAVELKLYTSFSLDAAVPRDHLVRRLADAVDLSFVRGLAHRYYSHTGKPSVDPIVIFKLVLLGYLFSITSERRLCEEAGLNLTWRWYLGYELDEEIPDHSVLSKARRRFGPAVYERFFRRIVQLCEARGLIQGDVLFVDATLVKANASPQSLRSRVLLEQRLSRPGEFVAQLWTVNKDTTEVAEEPRTRRGGRPRTDHPKALRSRSVTNDLSVSPSDPDAQMFRKPGKTPLLSHKTHLAVDGGRASIITAVEVRPACEADSHVVPAILTRHELAVGRRPRELVGDRGYGTEAANKACEERGVVATLAMRSFSNAHGSIHRDRFAYVSDRDIFICPAGQEMPRSGENRPVRTSIYRTPRGACAACPLKPECAHGRADRSVSRRWDGDLWEGWQAHLQSRHARHMLRRRQVVSERAFAVGKERHGLGRAQFRGRPNMRIQALMTAAAMNLWQLARFLPVRNAGVAVATTASLPAYSRPNSAPSHRPHRHSVRPCSARIRLTPDQPSSAS